MLPLMAMPAWAEDDASASVSADPSAPVDVMSVDAEDKSMVQNLAARLDAVQDLQQEEQDRNAAETSQSEAASNSPSSTSSDDSSAASSTTTQDAETGAVTDFVFGSSSQLSDEDLALINGGSAASGAGASLPSSYIAPATTVKDQGDDNICWSFATMAALESSRLIQNGARGTTNISAGIAANTKRAAPDYSEAQTVYATTHSTTNKLDHRKPRDFDTHGDDKTDGFNTGANWYDSADTLADWEGVVHESTTPFTTEYSQSAFSTMTANARRNVGKSIAHLQSADAIGAPWPVVASTKKNNNTYYTRKRNDTAFEVIKNAIKSKGGVIASFHAPSGWNSGEIKNLKEYPDGSVDFSFADSSPVGLAGRTGAGWTYNADTGNSGGSITTNHTVEIVGWDDSYSRYNFATYWDSTAGESYDSDVAELKTLKQPAYGNYSKVLVPRHDGAWIIKNSWGAGNGFSGYQYISYDDKTFWGMYQFQLEDVSKNKTDSQHEFTVLHQYDGTNSLGALTSSGSISEANIFTGQGEKVQAVGVWTQGPNTTVNLAVYTGVSANAPESGTKTASKSVVIGRAGYHIVALNSPVYVAKGERFSVVAALKAKQVDESIGLDRVNYAMIEVGHDGESYGQFATASAGQSFVKTSKWTDVSAMGSLTGYVGDYTIGNVKLKALGNSVSVKSVTNPSVSTVAGSAPKLPATVLVKWSDGGFSQVPVSWDAVPASRYARTGSFTVAGRLSDGTKVTASVKVTPKVYTVSFDSQGGSGVASQRVTVGQRASRPANPSRSGFTFAGWYTAKSGGSKYDFSKPVTRNLTLYARWTKKAQPAASAVVMFRLYNPNSGEHFYTGNAVEKNHLAAIGWKYEGVGWTAPAKSGTPVYRLYNPNAGDHHYTLNKAERDNLVRLGWRYEGIGWYSAENSGRAPLYREYNPNARSGAHNYTLSKAENDMLVRVGWRYEGVAWYAVHA
ncbi:InlB B-repeat-containing protein [Bifidobacterium thermophilum]|nr:InlB B-repeat-containing protein [Bifidobacterium thermophilum]